MNEIILTRVESVARVALNRPERLNAMNGALMDQLADMLDMLANDPKTRCVLLTGEGSSFSAGGDLDETPSRRAEIAASEAPGPVFRRQVELLARRARSVDTLLRMPKPAIAAIRGYAVGGALALALACDLRICAEDAQLRLGFLEAGLSGDFGITWLLQMLVGGAKTRELCFLEPRLSGPEALRIGLVNRICAGGALDEEAMALARTLAAGPTLAYGLVKENLSLAPGCGLAEFLHHEAVNTRVSALSEDCIEAALARADRRPPRFEGR